MVIFQPHVVIQSECESTREVPAMGQLEVLASQSSPRRDNSDTVGAQAGDCSRLKKGEPNGLQRIWYGIFGRVRSLCKL